MPTLIDLRRRIQSVRNSQQITQAMKTVSTAKFRKAQRTVQEARPFWHLFPELMNRLAYWAAAGTHPLLLRRNEKRIAVMVITADKGLAGAYNSNLLAAADAFVAGKAATAEVRLVLVGKKAVGHFRKGPYPVDRAFGDRTDRLSRDELRGLAEELMRDYAFQKIDAVYIVSNEFKSILSPNLTISRLLPIVETEKEATPFSFAPDWEPDPERLLRSLLPLYLETQVYHGIFESLAAEQAARMMAMENATKNAEELINDLVLVLNKIRQASITKELLEIMTAVEALAK